VKTAMAAGKGRQRELVLRFFANAAAAIRSRPDQHRTWIMARCPWFDYMIQGNDRDDPKVFFFGKKSHDYGITNEQISLQGFSSDSLAMIELFRKETDLCRSAIDPVLEENYPDGLIRYFKGLFTPYGWDRKFESFMNRPDLGGTAVAGLVHRSGSI
jgi:hypothetical protein